MQSYRQLSCRHWLRVMLIAAAVFAAGIVVVPQASAEEWVYFDGFVFDTDGVTPVKSMVLVEYPAYPDGIVTQTFTSGYRPYGYYIIRGKLSGGTAKMYAYTYTDGPDPTYMNRMSPEVFFSLDGVANGTYLTRNLTLHALSPPAPEPTVNAGTTPAPKTPGSGTVSASPGNCLPPVAIDVDVFGLLKLAAIVAVGIIAVLLVLYCLAILIVTRL